MDISVLMDSDWLIHMLSKSSEKPQTRLLALFDILEDWLSAPHSNQTKTHLILLNEASFYSFPTTSCQKLQRFLAIEATKAGVAFPEMLANQLYYMAIAAAQEKIQANNPHSLSHAKSAASALITAQTQQTIRFPSSSTYAIAASFLGVVVVAGSLFIFNQPKSTVHLQSALHNTATVTLQTDQIASAQQTSALIAQIDQMRKGNCQLIEAIQLPDSYKKVYFENIVLGQISTNVNDQKLVHQLLDMVRCNYTPMLMANSKG